MISLSTRLERHQTERLTSGVGESGEDGVGESGEDGESEDEEGEDSSVDDRNMDHQSRRLSRSNVSEKRRKKMKAPLRDVRIYHNLSIHLHTPYTYLVSIF